MIVLWTDALIFLLVLVTITGSIYLLPKPQWQRPLAKIAHSKTGMLSLLMLLFFIGIGLLDSIHFKSGQSSSHEIISLLDYWAQDLRNHSEKTYSAPFATQLYSKEIIIAEDGSSQWTYPRLVYGGTHLKNPDAERLMDVVIKAGTGFAKGTALFLFILFAVWAVFFRRPAKTAFLFANPVAKAILLLAFCLVAGAYTLVDLSGYYHVFGTDKVGEDVFYQAIKSIRTGLVIGCLTTLVMLPLAVLFGIMAGFFQGWIDDVIQYVYTTLNSIPSVLLIAASLSIY